MKRWHIWVNLNTKYTFIFNKYTIVGKYGYHKINMDMKRTGLLELEQLWGKTPKATIIEQIWTIYIMSILK